MVISTSYPTRANGIIVLVNSQTGFYRRFLFPGLKLKTSCGKFLNLAHYFPYDVKLRLLAHSRSFLANQKARNAIVGAENLLMSNNWAIYLVNSSNVKQNSFWDRLTFLKKQNTFNRFDWGFQSEFGISDCRAFSRLFDI